MLDKTGTVTTGRMTVVRGGAGTGSGRRTTCCGWPARWRRRRSTRSAGRSPRRPDEPRCRRSATSGRRPASASVAGRGPGGRGRRAAPATRPRPGSRSAWTARSGGRIALADTVRPTSAAAIADLRELGLEPILVTGDSESGWPRAVAAEVGITEVVAGVLPAGKVDVVKRLQGARPVGRDGRRRGERRRRARPGRPGPGDGRRHRRGDRGVRPDPGPRRPDRGGGRRPAVPPHAVASSGATCSGRSPTTWRRCRWPRPACSTR